MVNMNAFKFGDKLKLSDGRMGVYILKETQDFISDLPKTYYHIVLEKNGEKGLLNLSFNDDGTLYMSKKGIVGIHVIGKWEDTQPTTGEAVSDGRF